MSAQISLFYRVDSKSLGDWERQLEAIRAAVQYLGLKEVSFKLDVSGTMLSDAINERDRKRWAGEWTCVVYRMLIERRDPIAMDLARQLYAAPLETAPHEVTERVVVKTPEQLSAEFEAELRAMGHVGEAAIKRVKGTASGR